jgi:hypothetical protein
MGTASMRSALGTVGARVGAVLRRHWLFGIVFAAAVAVRVLITLAFWPALFYIGDSFGYLESAYAHKFDEAHPAGYAVVIAVVSLPGRHLATLPIVNHLCGLAAGALLYVLLVRLRVPLALAAAAAALALLNGSVVVLEQHILSETLFTLAIVAVAFTAILYRGTRSALLSGLMLAAATLFRAIGIVAIPVWLAYLAWSRRTLRATAVGAIAVVLPLVAYASLHDYEGHGFGLTEWNGWLLYGRVAQIADCRGVSLPARTRGLCESAAERARRRAEGWTPSYYIFSPDSPAKRVFGPGVTAARSPILLRFARSIIEAHPLAYLRMVGSDVGWGFRPYAGSRGVDPSIVLHVENQDSDVDGNPVVQRYFGQFHLRDRGGRGAMDWYVRTFQVPRPLLGALLVCSLLSLLAAVAARGRARLPRQAASTFLLATALALFVGAVATVELNIRFLMPTVPLIAGSGALALTDLWALGALASRRPGARRTSSARSQSQGVE